MRGFVAILRRELFAYFVTPLAWVMMAAFLLLEGFFFFLLVLNYASQQEVVSDAGPVEAFFGQTILLYLPLLLVCPLLTMRSFAEERRSGTIEALLTAPVSSTAVVLGKYLASVLTYVALWAPTGLYMVVLSRYGDVDWRIVGTGYSAILLVGAGYLAIGTLSSALTTSQLTAAVVTSVTVLLLFAFGIGEFALDPGPARELCSYASVWSMMNDFSRGLVDSRRLVWCATVILLPLFVSVRTVESWRWG